ncbi:MAG: ABC transporter ATP-binding protein [Deltaproteobacteria bacterium]|nr:ABC transporter ATP-binding protein [Deltaproteobacteria bacterium]
MSYMQAEGLIKEYGSGETSFMAVRGMSFEIQQGEFAAIMGESGSGKSTLLTMMGALNSPTSGTYRVDDIDVYSLGQDQRAEFRREFLGFIFQSFYLIPYLTVIENVMLPLATARMASKEKRAMAESALEQVRMDGKTHRLPGEISGGEQERLAIARAIVNEPTILLADEPTGNLDSDNSHAVMKLFQTLNEAGMTIVMVTHSQDCAQYAKRMLRVSDGLLVDEEEAIQEPNNLSEKVMWAQTGKVAHLAS